MPVRKIPKNYRSVTGYFPSLVNQRAIAYESSLERDFFLLLEYDDEVLKYEEQPLVINYRLSGANKSYTPDCLIFYKERLSKKPLIAEIKYTSELEEKKYELEEKFDAIRRHVAENDMDFRIFTEKNIRGPYLENLKFLNKFSREPGDLHSHRDTIVRHIAEWGKVTVRELMNALAADPMKKARVLPVLWYMVRTKTVKTDLTKPLDNNSELEVTSGKDII